jgi:hypothetical protein
MAITHLLNFVRHKVDAERELHHIRTLGSEIVDPVDRRWGGKVGE